MAPSVLDMQNFLFGRADIGQIAPEIILFIWSCAILLGVAFIREKGRFKCMPFALALAGLAMATAAYVRQVVVLCGQCGPYNGIYPFFNGMYSFDGMTAFFKGIFLLAGWMTVLLTPRFLDEEKAPKAEFFALLLLSITAMMFLAGSNDLISIYICLEFMAISIYILVGYLKDQPRSTEASLKYFILGAFSSGFILFGMSFIYGLTGATELPAIRQALSVAGAANQPLLVMALFFILAGVGFKVAAVPFHMWCPDAYEGAPTPFTAFMSIAPKAAAFAMFIRLFAFLFEPITAFYVPLLGLLSILTMTMGNILAVKQTNIKRLLAYSSISHAGYILMGMMVRNHLDDGSRFLGLQGIGVYLVCYLFMNLGAFAVVIFMHRKGIAGEELDDYNGLIHRSPGLAVGMCIFLLSLAGIPPMAGFLAKYWIFSGVISEYLRSHDKIFLYVAVAGALNAALALFYYFRIVKRMFMGDTPQPETAMPVMGWGGKVVFAVALVGTMAIGLYPDPVIRAAAWIGQALIGVY